MTEISLAQLIDMDQIRPLLEAHYKLTGVCSAILDLNQNILVAEGWQEICSRFHRGHPVTCARCIASNESLTERLHEQEDSYRECLCENGLWDVAMPIIINGRHVANIFTGLVFLTKTTRSMNGFSAPRLRNSVSTSLNTWRHFGAYRYFPGSMSATSWIFTATW